MLPVADGSDMMGSLRTPRRSTTYGLRTSMAACRMGPPTRCSSSSSAWRAPWRATFPDLAMLLSVQAGLMPACR